MSDTASQPPTHYCFHCGHKVDPTRETCWYCGARLKRLIREPKKCPFCGSMIPSDAIKCRHCGEFVDGRASAAAQAAPAPQQVVFVVDRALLGDPRGGAYRLLPGQPVPLDVARQLSAPTVRAIETNQPRLLDDPRVRALPAPPAGGDDHAGGMIDIDAEVSSPGSGGRGGAALPARREDVGGVGRGGSGGMLAAIGKFLMRTAPGARQRPQATPDDAIEVKTEGRYRVCAKCGTEILADDNFCYHCGAQYRQAEVDLGGPVKRRRGKGGNTFFHGLAAAACLVLGVMVSGLVKLPAANATVAILSVAGVGLLACVIAFFRRRTFFNQFVSVVLGLGIVAGLVCAFLK